ncbi:hypothetical protein Q4E40_16095 [Pontibacter sp. BT731]|uniref:hypothetical protein n=1 Tax=Pontibacter coccineus TaxID=3063328 RepID=UPI0026E2B962|nr:hypothetical protein [Pontibacter sp. BT731]MDO6391657.1 hypothetical protein [Pontibacter sp. BT731]
MIKLLSLTIFFCILSIGLKAQTEDEQLAWVIDELKLDKDSVLLNLAAVKRYPASVDLTIVCIPSIVEYVGEDLWTADVFVALLNKKSKKIIYQNFKRGLVADAIYPSRIWIDTAPYNVSPKERAFAIRIEAKNNSRAASFSGEEFWLMLAKAEKVERLLQLDSEIFISYGGGDCESTEIHKQKSTFVLSDKLNDKGYFDLIEKINYQHFFMTEECEDGKKEIKNFKNTFKYKGGQYLAEGKREKGF